MNVQSELEKRLEQLKELMGMGKELTVEWMPSIKNEKLPFDKDATLRGQVNKTNRCLEIFDSNLDDALRTVIHEYVEYIIDCQLIDPYVILYNNVQRAYEKAFMENNYHRKECVIEVLVKILENLLKGGENEK